MPTPASIPATIEVQIKEGRLAKVARDNELIKHLLSQSNLHIESAQKLIDGDDLVAAHLVAYDAIRKSCAALLVSYGLRATSRGGHYALFECAAALSSDLQDYFPDLDILRRQRDAYEYPTFAGNEPTKFLVEQVIEMARTVLAFVKNSS